MRARSSSEKRGEGDSSCVGAHPALPRSVACPRIFWSSFTTCPIRVDAVLEASSTLKPNSREAAALPLEECSDFVAFLQIVQK